MPTSAIAGALTKQTSGQTPAQPTGTDAQNAAVLASIAAPSANAAQNQQAASAVSSRLASLDHAAPQAFAQQQQASAQAPHQLAANIASQEKAGTGAYNGAMSAGTGDYLSQISATMPLVNALVSAQVAQANNSYAQQQAQNSYNQDYLKYQNRNLDYENRNLDQSQSNPILYGNAGQKAAAQQQVLQHAQTDTGLAQQEKDAIIGTAGSPSVYDYASALNYYNSQKKPGIKYDDGKVLGYLNSYYGGAAIPALSPASAPAPTGPHGPSAQSQVLQGFQQAFSPSNIANGAKTVGHDVANGASLARQLLGF